MDCGKGQHRSKEDVYKQNSSEWNSVRCCTGVAHCHVLGGEPYGHRIRLHSFGIFGHEGDISSETLF